MCLGLYIKRISSRSLATVLIKAEILGFICSHKKLLISSAYDIPRNGCEKPVPCSVVGATTETESTLVLLSSQLAPSSYIRRKEAPTW